MLSNDMASSNRQQAQNETTRSKDDEMVAYFFQRPEMEQQFSGGKRWMGDESVLDQARTVSDIEREFHSMSFSEKSEHHEVPTAQVPKKLWQDDKSTEQRGEESRIFSPSVDFWSPRQEGWHPNRFSSQIPRSDFGAVPNFSLMQRMRGSYTGGSSDQMISLSPRSSETGALGVNMAEYVLGAGPSLSSRDRTQHLLTANKMPNEENKMRNENPGFSGGRVGDLSNGVMPSHISTFGRPFRNMPAALPHSPQIVPAYHPGFAPVQYQTTPFQKQQQPQVDDSMMVPSMHPLGHQQMQQHAMGGGGHGMHFDSIPFDQVQVDEPSTAFLKMDFSNTSMLQADSSGFGHDYNQQLMTQHQQQQRNSLAQPQMTMVPQPPYGVTPQHQPMGLQAFASAPPFIINHPQESYGMSMPGPTGVPQYYSPQPPWGIYLAAPMHPQQQQQDGGQLQQLLRNRPMSPQSGPEPTAQIQSQAASPSANYQILTPAFYDQSGQFVLGNGRGLGTPVRLVSPASILVNTATGQQAGYAQPSGLFTPVISTPLSLTPQSAGGGVYAGTSTPSGMIGPGRDLFCNTDFKTRQYGQYYGGMPNMSPNNPLGFMPPGTSQPLTPTSSNLSFGVLGMSTGGSSNLTRNQYSSAPGAENKFRVGSVPHQYPVPGLPLNNFNNGLIFAPQPSNFNSQQFFNQQHLPRQPPKLPNGAQVGIANKDQTGSGRSQLLEDFRNNLATNLQLKDLVGHLVEFSQDQHGSRFIQQKLERASPTEKQMVYNEILSSAYNLMTDVFGNYVIQKFFEFGTPEQKQGLAQKIRGHVLLLALQMYGCRIVQKALESVPSGMQIEIVKELDGHVQKCVKDQNGNHVVQKCIECVDPNHIQFIIDAFKGQVMALSAHPYGCRIIQRILEHCTPEQKAPIMEELHQHCEYLISDQYGNYVIQHVLEHGKPEDKSRIVAQVKNKVLALSQHKFASNVVEKCVAHASRSERAQLIEEICSTPDGQNCALFTMMKDQFANYVVQRMIDVADPPQRKQLIVKLKLHVSVLRKYTYGKHILAKLEKYYMKNSDMTPGVPSNGAI